jgi:hypothetical protein
MESRDQVAQDIANKKKTNTVAAFFASAAISPFVATAVLLGAVAEATWDVIKAVIGAIGDILAISIVAPFAILGYGTLVGWDAAGPHFPLNILTAAAGFAVATVPAAFAVIFAPTAATIIGAFDIVKGVSNAGWTLLKGVTGSIASLFALPAACAYEVSKDVKADMNLVAVLEEQVGYVASKYKDVIRDDFSLFSDKPLVLGVMHQAYYKDLKMSVSSSSGLTVSSIEKPDIFKVHLK